MPRTFVPVSYNQQDYPTIRVNFPFCNIVYLTNSILFLFLKAPITDQELLALSKDLHINDVNGAIVKLDLQGQTTIGDITTDNAPSRYRNQNKLFFYHSM